MSCVLCDRRIHLLDFHGPRAACPSYLAYMSTGRCQPTRPLQPTVRVFDFRLAGAVLTLLWL